MNPEEIKVMTEGWTTAQFQTYILNLYQLERALQHAGARAALGMENEGLKTALQILSCNHILITATHDHTKTNT